MKSKLTKDKKLPFKAALYVFGIFLISFGAALNIISNMGVSAMQAVPLVAHFITGLSIGTCLFLMLAFFTALQVVILRKEFRPVSLAQLPVAFVFGYFMDFSNFLLINLQPSSYLEQVVIFSVGTFITANGVALYIKARLINMPGEALTIAITEKLPGSAFHKVRIVQDSSLVVIAAVLSLVILGGLYGVREGTVISAVLVGKLIPFANRIWKPVLTRIGAE